MTELTKKTCKVDHQGGKDLRKRPLPPQGEAELKSHEFSKPDYLVENPVDADRHRLPLLPTGRGFPVVSPNGTPHLLVRGSYGLVGRLASSADGASF